MRRAAALLAALLLSAFTLGGCSSLRKLVDPAQPAQARTSAEAQEREGDIPADTGDAEAAAPAAAAGAASAPKAKLPPAYTLRVQAPNEVLRKLLATHLDLARFQNPETAGEITALELNRLIAGAPAQARSLLETEGHFNAQVQVARSAGAPPVLTVSVEPGPRATVERIDVVTQGPLQLAEEAGDKDARHTTAQLASHWPLAVGAPFTQSAWSDAKNNTIARLRADGYPLAQWSGTSAQVDPQKNSVRLYVVADSGPLFHFGELRIRGLERYSESAVRNLNPIKPGTPYRESQLADFQEQLQKAGLFEAATVLINPKEDNADALPVQVRVRELQKHQAVVGIGISANTGPRISLEHTDRKLFGWNATAKNTFEIGKQQSSWEGQIISHPLPGLHRNLVAGGASELDQNNEILTAWNLRAGRTQDTERIDRLYYLEVLSAKDVTEAKTTFGKAVTANYNWIWRKVDNLLLPTRGLTLSTELATGYAFDTSTSNGPFVRALGTAVAYVPFGDAWYGQARLQGGAVLAKSEVGVPDTLLFRAGGDDSVRGYAYRELGPQEDGTTVSGRILFTSSLEVAHPFTPKLPSLLWAAFVDAGQAGDKWKGMTPALGYGLGVRYRSPVGPLKVDLAYGQQVRAFRLHVSVGVAL